VHTKISRLLVALVAAAIAAVPMPAGGAVVVGGMEVDPGLVPGMGCASWGVSTNIVTDHPVTYRHWLTDLDGDLVADGGAIGVGAGTYHLANLSWHAPFVVCHPPGGRHRPRTGRAAAGVACGRRWRRPPACGGAGRGRTALRRLTGGARRRARSRFGSVVGGAGFYAPSPWRSCATWRPASPVAAAS